ncbi:hypothetical protein [Actinomadura sp. 9N407]|uniref:hypothetical protein n=1 Tax=Actinomadura sp. 9N407 TaxID=3375154 RepID=UPI0037AC0E6D
MVFTVLAFGGSQVREACATGVDRIDWTGSALFVAALALLMFALPEAPTLGWQHPVIVLTGVAGLAALIIFGIVRRRSTALVLAPALVANCGFLGWSLATLTTSIGFLGGLVFLPTYLQAAAGLTPAAAGVTMQLLTVPVLITPTVAVTLMNKGAPALLLIMIALLLVVAGNLWLVRLHADDAVVTVAAPLVMIAWAWERPSESPTGGHGAGGW